jgi:hypothetical protein
MAVIVALGIAGVLGVRTGHVSDSGGGYELKVTYARVTRPGLATPWSVEIRHPGGFDGPITVRTTSAYFDLFDENSLDPEPTKTLSDGENSIWEFEPPEGDTMEITFDARLEPGVQVGGTATTSVLVDGRRVASVTYRTRVFP